MHALKVTTLLGDVEAKSSVQQLSPEQLAELKQRASTQGSAVKDAKMVGRCIGRATDSSCFSYCTGARPSIRQHCANA